MQCYTKQNAKMRITNAVLDSNPIFKTQLNLNMNVLLCFVVLLSYPVLHLELGRAVLQLDISSNCIMYTSGKLLQRPVCHC